MPARLAARRINNAKKIDRRPESRAEQVAARPVEYREVQERAWRRAHPLLNTMGNNGAAGSLRTGRNSGA